VFDPALLRRIADLALTVVLAAAAGWLCMWLRVPLPWMVGPLVVTAGRSMLRGAPAVPRSARWGGQIVISSAVGLTVTAATMAIIGDNIAIMVLAAVVIILASGLLAATMMRMAGVHRATALFAALPGGPLEMAGLARRYGGQGGLVAFAQTLRVAAIVILIPPLLVLTGAHIDDITMRPASWNWLGLALVLSIALASGVLLMRLKIANPFFLGPMTAVGLASLLGAPLSALPGPLIAVAQIALGISLGCMFDRSLVREARAFVLHGASISAILIALSFAIAGAVTVITGDSFQLLVLANAPGSVTEMAVVAKGMGYDVSLVTAFHLVRILIIVPFAELIFRAFGRVVDLIDRNRPPPPGAQRGML
jgi:membrane AbrB-like protein